MEDKKIYGNNIKIEDITFNMQIIFHFNTPFTQNFEMLRMTFFPENYKKFKKFKKIEEDIGRYYSTSLIHKTTVKNKWSIENLRTRYQMLE